MALEYYKWHVKIVYYSRQKENLTVHIASSHQDVNHVQWQRMNNTEMKQSWQQLAWLCKRRWHLIFWHTHIPKTTRVQLLNDSPASLNASQVYVPESSGKISAIFNLYMLASFVYWKSLLGLISLLLWSHITSNFWAPIKQNIIHIQ